MMQKLTEKRRAIALMVLVGLIGLAVIMLPRLRAAQDVIVTAGPPPTLTPAPPRLTGTSGPTPVPDLTLPEGVRLGKGTVEDMALSPDNQTLAAATHRGLYLYHLDTHGLTDFLAFEQTGALNVVAWSPDGSLLATGTRDGMVTVWDGTTYQRMYVTAQNSIGPVTWLGFSPDSRTLVMVLNTEEQVSQSAQHVMIVRDALTGEERWLRRSEGRYSASFSPDGSDILANTGQDIWRAATGLIGETLAYSGSEHAWSPDGSLIVQSSRQCFGSCVAVLSAQDGEVVHEFSDGVVRAYWLPTEDHLLALQMNDNRFTFGRRAAVVLWDADTQEERGGLEEEGVSLTAISPDGRYAVVTMAHQNYMAVWDLTRDQPVIAHVVRSPFVPDQPLVWDDDPGYLVRWSADSKRLVIAHPQGQIAIWDITARRQVGVIDGHFPPSYYRDQIMWSADGTRLLATSLRDVALWDMDVREIMRRYAVDPQTYYEPYAWQIKAALDPSGETFAAVRQSGNAIDVYRLSDGHHLQTIGTEFYRMPSDIRYLASGRELVTISTGDAQIFQVDDGQRILLEYWPYGGPDATGLTTLSPDGTKAAANLGGGLPRPSVLIWDFGTGQANEPIVIDDNVNAVPAYAWSPDSREIAAYAQGQLIVYTVDPMLDSRVISAAVDPRRFITHTLDDEDVWSMAWLNDPRYIVMGTGRGEILLVNVETGEVITRWQAHASEVVALAASPDDSSVASLGRDGTIFLQPLPPMN